MRVHCSMESNHAKHKELAFVLVGSTEFLLDGFFVRGSHEHGSAWVWLKPLESNSWFNSNSPLPVD